MYIHNIDRQIFLSYGATSLMNFIPVNYKKMGWNHFYYHSNHRFGEITSSSALHSALRLDSFANFS